MSRTETLQHLREVMMEAYQHTCLSDVIETLADVCQDAAQYTDEPDEREQLQTIEERLRKLQVTGL